MDSTLKKPEINSLYIEEIAELLQGGKAFRAKQVFEWIHAKCATSFEEMTNVPKEIRNKLEDETVFLSLFEVESQTSKDKSTTKYLFKTRENELFESVLMRQNYGDTVCVSSQIGCKMGCVFCKSGANGFLRNLSAGEIALQVYMIQKTLDRRISNIVVMGCGEPFDNFDEVMKFLRLLNDKNGLNIGQRNMTVSTCGIVSGILKFADLNTQINLAVSLHASNDEKRLEIMPIAKTNSLKDLIGACDYYTTKTGRRISFEYALISGKNDSQDDAKQLGALIGHCLCHVNLIPLNATNSELSGTSMKFAKNFLDVLSSFHVNATMRQKKGDDISAACGQLVGKHKQSGAGENMTGAGKTDKGLVRTNNEDAFFVTNDSIGGLCNLYVISDGMGGASCGEVASSSAIDFFCEFIARRNIDEDGANVLDLLIDGVVYANSKVYAFSLENPECFGMGATFTAMTIYNGKAYIAHVGDSRAYVFRNEKLDQITSDHTFVNEMVKAGHLTKEEAEVHPRRNIITRALGTEQTVSVDGVVRDIHSNDSFLLCTDGLTNMVSDAEILKILKQKDDIETVCFRLVEGAKNEGGSDNISVIFARISEVTS